MLLLGIGEETGHVPKIFTGSSSDLRPPSSTLPDALLTLDRILKAYQESSDFGRYISVRSIEAEDLDFGEPVDRM